MRGGGPLLLKKYNCAIKESTRNFRPLLMRTPVRQLAMVKYKYLDNINVYFEKKAAFDQDVLNVTGKDIFLSGYWGSEKYFKNIQSIIRKEFTLKESLSPGSKQWEEKIKSAVKSVSIHVRRGDYINTEINRKIYAVVPPEYYYKCIEMLKQKYNDLSVFVFSNDIAWCRENLRFDLPMEFVEGNDEDHGYEDMHLMSLCKHNIIANSTFSWWGAWLNSNPEKMVFYPEKFFNIKDKWHDTIDGYPDDWIKVSNENC